MVNRYRVVAPLPSTEVEIKVMAEEIMAGLQARESGGLEGAHQPDYGSHYT